jgi:hypothetical protein
MNDVIAGLAVALAVVFAISAIAKTWRPSSAIRLVATITPGFARPLVFASIAAESIVAIALVATPRLGGLLATVALVALSMFAAIAARRAPGVGCACFGARSAPIGPATFARNGLLVVASLAVASRGGASITALGVLTSGGLVALGALAVALVELRTATGSVFGEVERIRRWDLESSAEVAS